MDLSEHSDMTTGAASRKGVRTDELTPREREVLDLLAAGCTNVEIAEAMEVAWYTARNHVSNVLAKLGVESRDDAAAWWRQHRSDRPVPEYRRRRWARAFLNLVPMKVVAAATGVAIIGGVCLGLVVLAVTASSGGESPRGSLEALGDGGGVFHSRQRFVSRTEPGADAVQQTDDPYVLPPEYVRESWFLVAADGNVAEGITVVRDADGVIIQRSHQGDGELVVESPEQGTTRTFPIDPEPRPLGLGALLDGARADYEARVETGELTPSPRPGDAEAGLIQYVEEVARSRFGGGTSDTGTSYPHTGDLSVARYYREHVVTSEYLPVSTTTWAELDDGSRVRVEREEWEAFEGLPADAWDPEGFAGGEILDEPGTVGPNRPPADATPTPTEALDPPQSETATTQAGP